MICVSHHPSHANQLSCRLFGSLCNNGNFAVVVNKTEAGCHVMCGALKSKAEPGSNGFGRTASQKFMPFFLVLGLNWTQSYQGTIFKPGCFCKLLRVGSDCQVRIGVNNNPCIKGNHIVGGHQKRIDIQLHDFRQIGYKVRQPDQHFDQLFQVHGGMPSIAVQ